MTNKTDISELKTSVASNLASIQVNASGITELNGKVTSQQTQISTLLARSIGGFFESESDLLDWLKNADNTKNLEVGAGLFVNNDTSFYYIWNGNEVVKFMFLEDVTGGYLTVINPNGTGQITMNDCSVGSYGAAFGKDNTVRKLYGLASGQGLTVVYDGGAAFGKYNKAPEDDEIFSVGCGTSNDNRKTIMSISDDGSQQNGGDVIAFAKNYTSDTMCDISKSTTDAQIQNMDGNIYITTEYDKFYQSVAYSETNSYILTYTSELWQLSNPTQKAVYSDLSELGITFRYRDGTTGTPSITFTDGDTITIYAPPQGQISMRDMYTAFNKLHLYVDEDGDVCQED